MNILKVKCLYPNSILPERATDFSAGYDLCACISEPLLLPAGGRVMVPTGLAIELDVSGQPAAAFIFGRSGLGAKHGITLSNAVGVVDADYRGEIMVPLSNHGAEDYLIQPAERIAQLVVLPVLLPFISESRSLSETGRGQGGFGSTGKSGSGGKREV